MLQSNDMSEQIFKVIFCKRVKCNRKMLTIKNVTMKDVNKQ